MGTALDRLINVPATNPTLDPEDAAYIREIFAPDTAALEELLGRGLGSWGA